MFFVFVFWVLVHIIFISNARGRAFHKSCLMPTWEFLQFTHSLLCDRDIIIQIIMQLFTLKHSSQALVKLQTDQTNRWIYTLPNSVTNFKWIFLSFLMFQMFLITMLWFSSRTILVLIIQSFLHFKHVVIGLIHHTVNPSSIPRTFKSHFREKILSTEGYFVFYFWWQKFPSL